MTDQPILFEAGSPLDPSMIDDIKVVKVSNGGARCGCVSVPECLLFDPTVTFSDRGIYSVVAATSSVTPIHWAKFCVGAPRDRTIDALRRLGNAGYLSAVFRDGNLDILIHDVQAYSPLNRNGGNVVDIQGVRKPPPVNPAPHMTDEGYKPFKATDPDNCPDNITQELWLEWIEFRRDNNHSIRKAHVGRMKALIEGFGKDGAACVVSSINNGYKGLFPLRGGAASQRSTQILREVDRQDFEDEI